MKALSRRQLIAGGIAASALPVLGSAARAQSSWPNRSIKLVVGFPAGGQSDLFARQYGEYISSQTGQTVVVENKAGGGGVLAAVEVKRAQPDGYTMMVTSTTPMTSNRLLIKNLPYETEKDFIIVSIMPTGGLPFVVSNKTKVSNLAEFVEYARKTPNVSVGTWAPGSTAHIAISELNKQFGLDIQPVHYRGENAMWTDVAGGAIDGGIGSYGAAVAVIDSGRGKAIAVSGKRIETLPDVASFTEQGATSPAFRLTGYQCFSVPTGTPPEVVNRISELLVAGGKSEKIRTLMTKLGIRDSALSFADTQKLYQTETPLQLELVKSLGLTPS